MKNKVPKAFLLAFVLMLGLGSCKKEFEPDCSGNVPTYDADVRAIAVNSCILSGCHDANSSRDYSTFEKLSAKGADGTLKFNVVDNPFMPPQGSSVDPLSDDERSKIACWIEGGLQED